LSLVGAATQQPRFEKTIELDHLEEEKVFHNQLQTVITNKNTNTFSYIVSKKFKEV
jgi:hypothetical protein